MITFTEKDLRSLVGRCNANWARAGSWHRESQGDGESAFARALGAIFLKDALGLNRMA
jgi:hypothetical protein